MEQNTFICDQGRGDGIYFEFGIQGKVQPGVVYVRNNIFWHNWSSSDFVITGNTLTMPDWVDYVDSNVIYAAQGSFIPYKDLTIALFTTETATSTYLSATSFTLSGDRTADYPVGRVVRLFNGVYEGTTSVSAASYAAGTNSTTVMLIDGFATPLLSTVQFQSGQKNVGDPGFGSRDAALAVDPMFAAPGRSIDSYTGSTKEVFFRNMLTLNGFDEQGRNVTPSVQTVGGLIQYLQDGFTPLNQVLQNSGEGGVTPGAVPVGTLP